MGQDKVVELARWRAQRTAEMSGPSPLERVANGEAGAVEACVDAYAALVRGLAQRLLPKHADVDDVVQEIFVELWRSASRFDSGRASDRGFVATIARRRIIDRRRRMDRRPETTRIEAGMDRGDNQHERTLGRVEAAPARQALELLSEEHRRWVLMAVVDGYTHTEIAESTGTPLGTVKSGIRRGLARMRTALEPMARSLEVEG